MKAMVCEMCQSNELIKQDGVYVCQHCGTKYTVEEARKLLVEGIVKIDESEKIDNLLKSAKNYLDLYDYAHAGDLYSKAAEINSENWRAVFFSIYCSAKLCKMGQVPHYIDVIAEGTRPIPDMICKDYSNRKDAVPDLMEYYLYLEEISEFLVGALGSAARKDVSMEKKQLYVSKGTYAMSVLLSLGDVWLDNPIFAEDSVFVSFLIERFKAIYKFSYDICSITGVFTTTSKAEFENMAGMIMNGYYIDKLTPIIRRESPEYISAIESKLMRHRAELERQPTQVETKKSGCYVATAVYGSYDCPEVWTLRRFRDCTLAETWYGRTFIRAYYAISPTLVKWFGSTEWFKNLWRPTLDRMVVMLNKSGVADTPYDDRVW